MKRYQGGSSRGEAEAPLSTKVVGLTVMALALALTTAVAAAPLDDKDRKGQDALQVLKERGLLEGYDKGGALKGDRALSRWEMAMIMARFLSLHEGKQTQFLSKAELDAVNKAVRALEPELQGLGVRVSNLEEQLALLDQRVTERERIRFKGQLITVLNTMNFKNTGQDFGGPKTTGINYGDGVGTLVTSNLVPHSSNGIIPSVDLIKGRPLLNGQGFSSTLYLDVEAEPSTDWLLTTRLYAYSATGSSVIDQVYGAPAPYLSNSFTGNAFSNPQSADHAPFTRMGLDHVTLLNESTGTSATLGTFRPRYFSNQIYSGEINPSVGGPRFLESYGFQGTGDLKLAKDASLGWEVIGTRLPDGNPTQMGFTPYDDEAYGAALNLKWKRLTAGVNFFRAASNASEGQPLVTGLSNLTNGASGQVQLNWVNPPNFFSGRLATDQSGGIGSTSDTRPVPGIANSDLGGTKAGFGPQGITLMGGTLAYNADDWNLRGEYARSSYKSNRNSPYVSEGNLWSLGGGVELFDHKVQLDLDYRYTDANYDPMILVYPGTAAGVDPFRVYHRFPDFGQFWSLYSLHDTVQFPNNRKGVVVGAKWNYDDNGSVKFTYRDQTQVRTSLQDVRYNANQLAPGVPGVPVLGFAPGFFDMVFREYSPLSFDSNLHPRENQQGSLQAYGLDWHHQFGDSPWSVEFRYDQYHFSRPTALSPALGGSQNKVDLLASVGHARVGYQATKDWGLGLGYDVGVQRGHYDPFGVYNPFAIANNSVDFHNRDSIQHQPFIDTSYALSESVKWRSDYRWYSTVDNVPASTYAGLPGGPASQAHPFAFDGYSITTRLEINF